MSTTARRYWLKILRGIGVKNFRATSGLGLPYICHVGDFSGEVPFYGRSHSTAEIAVMAAWCRTENNPVVFDVGANNGFVATQLAQLIRGQSGRIYAFEPVPSTYAHMVTAIAALELNDVITPICCGVSDSNGVATLTYNPRESLFAQVRDNGSNPRVGSQTAAAAMVTLDQVVESMGVKPTLLKIDVEGFEARVFAGARNLLSDTAGPAICFEWNPLTSREVGGDVEGLKTVLSSYRLFYVDDFEGQKRPFGEQIEALDQLDQVCNLFAIPLSSQARWDAVKPLAVELRGKRS